MLRLRRPALAPDALIFGLGNPGPRYARTRHNAGWWALDALLEGRKPLGRSTAHKSQAVFIELACNGQGVLAALIKPQTYMNLSGDCLKAWRRAHPKARIVVAYDDFSLSAGKLRVREKGSAGGHNGIKSILAALGSDSFLRLKIGVGGPPPDWDSAEHVLDAPPPEERQRIDAALPLAARVLECLACGDPQAALRLLSQSGNAPREKEAD